LPVLGVQPSVVVATSMALEATEAGTLGEEGVVLPRAIPGTGALNLDVGTGRLPSLLVLSSGLLSLREDRFAAERATTLLAVLSPLGMLQPYSSSSSAAQVLLEATHALLNGTLLALDKITDAAGLHYSERTMQYQGCGRGSCIVDLHLNALAVLTLRRLQLAGVPLPAELVALHDRWRAALQSGLETAALADKQRGTTWRDLVGLASYRLALGRSWTPANSDLARMLSTERLHEGAESLSTDSIARLVCIELLPANPSSDAMDVPLGQIDERVRSYLDRLQSILRVTGRTAYLAASPSSASSAGMTANSFGLYAMALAQRAGALLYNVDKLANFVARSNDVRFAASHQGFALVEYDLATSSTVAQIELEVLVGEGDVLHTSALTTSAPPPPPLRVPWSELPPAASALLFHVKGVGEAAVAVSLHFVPAALPSSPAYRGIQVLKVIQQFDSVMLGPTSTPVRSVPLGSVVTVTIELFTPDDLHSVLVEDWAPAGLEPLDPNLAGGGTDEPPDTWPLWMRPSCWEWWGGRCTTFARQTMADRVAFVASFVGAGTHTLSYEAIAVTRGSFAVPPTTASVELEPEVMGQSASGVLDVGDLWVALPAGAVKPPPTCLNECSNKGVCVEVEPALEGRDEEGVCRCDPLSTGADCSGAAVVPVLGVCADTNCTVTQQTTYHEELTSRPIPIEIGDFKLTTINMVLVVDEEVRPAVPQSFLAKSHDEALLPSSHLQLTRAQSDAGVPILTLTIANLPSRPQWPANVSLSVAGSTDGVLFGSGNLVVEIGPVPFANTGSCLQLSEMPTGCVQSDPQRRCSCEYVWSSGCPSPQAVEKYCE